MASVVSGLLLFVTRIHRYVLNNLLMNVKRQYYVPTVSTQNNISATFHNVVPSPLLTAL